MSRPHINIEATSDDGAVVGWRRVDSLKQVDDGSILVRDHEGRLVGVIPSKGWLVKIEYRTGKEGAA